MSATVGGPCNRARQLGISHRFSLFLASAAQLLRADFDSWKNMLFSMFQILGGPWQMIQIIQNYRDQATGGYDLWQIALDNVPQGKGNHSCRKSTDACFQKFSVSKFLPELESQVTVVYYWLCFHNGTSAFGMHVICQRSRVHLCLLDYHCVAW